MEQIPTFHETLEGKTNQNIKVSFWKNNEIKVSEGRGMSKRIKDRELHLHAK